MVTTDMESSRSDIRVTGIASSFVWHQIPYYPTYALRNSTRFNMEVMLIHMVTQADLNVPTLGERRIRSPLPMSTAPGDGVGDFMPDDAPCCTKSVVRPISRLRI